MTALTAGAVLVSGGLTAPARAAEPHAPAGRARTAAVSAFREPMAKAPAISAKGGFVMDDDTGRTLFTKAADTRRSIASTAKVMTARVVLATKDLDLDAKVRIRKVYRDYIAANNASTARLVVGDRLTVRQLLYAMMLPSGCDASYALADTFGSGRSRAARVKSFIGKMNRTAERLGLRNTHFDSFDGIGHGANYSTPRDLTWMASEAMTNATFRAIVRTKSTRQRVTTKNGGHRTMTWTNTNRLLMTHRGVTGVKTGSGPVAGFCLVFMARRGGRTVIGTVLASPTLASRTADAKKLMTYAFGR
jgi:D-alanyl-D-alanine carboxypeptidase (penicillin-binding protein 5/6)